MKFEDFLNSVNVNVNVIVETYFDEKLKECGNYDELPRELINCTCCKRHRTNFPVLGEYIKSKPLIKSESETEYISKYNSNCKCKCPCRHIARHICREWDLIHEVEDISEEDSFESEDEDSAGSLEDFIVPDKGFKKKERKHLDKALDKFRGKKGLRR